MHARYNINPFFFSGRFLTSIHSATVVRVWRGLRQVLIMLMGLRWRYTLTRPLHSLYFSRTAYYRVNCIRGLDNVPGALHAAEAIHGGWLAASTNCISLHRG